MENIRFQKILKGFIFFSDAISSFHVHKLRFFFIPSLFAHYIYPHHRDVSKARYFNRLSPCRRVYPGRPFIVVTGCIYCRRSRLQTVMMYCPASLQMHFPHGLSQGYHARGVTSASFPHRSGRALSTTSKRIWRKIYNIQI